MVRQLVPNEQKPLLRHMLDGGQVFVIPHAHLAWVAILADIVSDVVDGVVLTLYCRYKS